LRIVFWLAGRKSNRVSWIATAILLSHGKKLTLKNLRTFSVDNFVHSLCVYDVEGMVIRLAQIGHFLTN